MRNRRGDAGLKLMLFVFIFLLLVIGIGIYAGSVIFYGNGYDFRTVDAEILNYLLRECVLENDLSLQFKEKSDVGLYEICGLNEDVLKEGNNFRISEGGEVKIFTGGDFVQCDFEGRNEYFAECSKYEMKVGDRRILVETLSSREGRRTNG